MRLFASVLLMTALVGCKHDRSFMNMNSDSGIPFLGLQLSVDARDVQPDRSRDRAVQVAAVEPTESPGNESAGDETTSPEWIQTSLSGQQTGSVQYSLPQLSTNEQVHPMSAIAHRLAAF